MSPVQSLEPSLLGAGTRSYSVHQSMLGPVPAFEPSELIACVSAAGLTGRGGAGFPTGRKLAAVAATRRGAVVVGNAAEGEPASSKDRVLLSQSPHLVLDGLLVAARATRATSAFLYAPADMLESVRPVVQERPERLKVTLVPAPDTFVAGQESAVVAAVQGLPALPGALSDPVYRRGVRGRPTLVQNVETLCQLALIARFGWEWFRGCGGEGDPGSRLVTLSGAVLRPAVYEVRGASSLGEIIGIAGGPIEPIQAVLVGGYHGGWVPWNDHTRRLPLTRAALEQYQAAPGAGVLLALPSRRCGLQAAAAITAYLAGETSGQCGPCVNGLPTLAGHLHDLAFRRGPRAAVRELHRVTGIVDGRGACQHPGGTARLIRSTLRTFSAEVDVHLAGHCRADQAHRSFP